MLRERKQLDAAPPMSVRLFKREERDLEDRWDGVGKRRVRDKLLDKIKKDTVNDSKVSKGWKTKAGRTIN